MKRIVTRLISVLLVTVMCISILPVQVFAWGKMTHIYTANVIEGLATEGTGSIAILDGDDSAFEYDIPDEFYEAIMAYPDAFRAGALGPDVYPDIFTGQVYIHPEDTVDDPEEDADNPEDDEDNKLLDEYKVDSGIWVVYLCDAVNKLPVGSEDRKMCLAFTLGCILHYCGDLYGHDFVNTFSGGAFPSFFSTEIFDIKGERLNNILSHLSIESYINIEAITTIAIVAIATTMGSSRANNGRRKAAHHKLREAALLLPPDSLFRNRKLRGHTQPANTVIPLLGMSVDAFYGTFWERRHIRILPLPPSALRFRVLPDQCRRRP